MSFLLDTDICSRYLRQPSKLFHRFIQHAGRLHVSAVGLSELYTWGYKQDDPSRIVSAITDLLKHSYICCSGAHKNCFGKQSTTMTGDPIPVEASPTGSCTYRSVCPVTWKSKCINPKADRDYGWVCPGYQNCTDWAWQGLD